MGQIGNGDPTPVYCDVSVVFTVNEKGAKEVKLRTAGYEKQQTRVMLWCTADEWKLPPYIVFK